MPERSDAAYAEAIRLITWINAELQAMRGLASSMPAKDSFTQNLLQRIDLSIMDQLRGLDEGAGDAT